MAALLAKEGADDKADKGSRACTVTCIIVPIRDFSPSDIQFQSLLDRLNDSEIRRIKKFRFKIDAYRSMLGRYIIRKMILNSSIDCKNYDKFLLRSKNNKPYLDTKSMALEVMDCKHKDQWNNFNFNVSHHGMCVAGVSSSDVLVGVDVMTYEYPKGCKSVEEFFQLMRRSFSESEWSLIYSSGTTEQSQLKTFYQLWSLKESYIKAIGVGLGVDLKTIEFQFGGEERTELPNMATLIKDGIEMKQWNFFVHYPDDEHVVSVAVGPLKESVDISLGEIDPPKYDRHEVHYKILSCNELVGN